MNPELRRNLWLQFSAIRLVLAPVVIGAILALTWLVADREWRGVAQVGEAIYSLLILLWGTRRAADLVAEEIAGGTWDGQRMSALGAWQMSWGKLLGGTSYVWYCAGLAFLAQVIAQWLDGTAPWAPGQWTNLLQLLGAGALAQAVAMLVSLALLAIGNVFCLACPFLLPRTLARRFLPQGRTWPRPFRDSSEP